MKAIQIISVVVIAISLAIIAGNIVYEKYEEHKQREMVSDMFEGVFENLMKNDEIFK